jgi:hypothetical protein
MFQEGGGTGSPTTERLHFMDEKPEIPGGAAEPLAGAEPTSAEPKGKRAEARTKAKAKAKKRPSTGATGTRERSSKKAKKPYPAVLLEKALQVPQEIKDKNGGHPWTPADVAAAVGVGAKTPALFYITAASRDFGLTTGTRDSAMIALTDLGREIVYAPSPAAEYQKKLEAFRKVEIFARVLAHYKGSDLPEMKYLGNTLEREFGLDPEYHDEFSTVFRENCKYLNIGSGNVVADGDGPRTVIVGEPSKGSTLKAFVIMPFTEKTPERSPGFFAEVLSSLITPAGTEANFTIETANRQGSDLIQSTIINELLDADLVIADLTDHNPNVMFELGLRMAKDKPVALIKAQGTGRVFDVDNMLRVFEYNPNLWRTTIDVDRPELAKHIKGTWENRTKDQSYMKILRNAARERE